MAKSEDYKEAEQERAARERGRSIPHYTKKVAKELATSARRKQSGGRSTPPKKSSK